MITQKELKAEVHYNELTGIFTRRKSVANNKVKKGQIAGNKHNEGYVTVMIKGNEYLAHRLAWFYVHGYWPENDIDHKDRIRHHNWIDNLRESSRQCNIRNRGNISTNTSGVKGVCWHKAGKKWHATITLNNKSKHLGLFIDFDEAVCHRLAAEQCLDWSNCDSNSPAFAYVNEMLKRGLI